jgi:hypothetical protein
LELLQVFFGADDVVVGVSLPEGTGCPAETVDLPCAVTFDRLKEGFEFFSGRGGDQCVDVVRHRHEIAETVANGIEMAEGVGDDPCCGRIAERAIAGTAVEFFFERGGDEIRVFLAEFDDGTLDFFYIDGYAHTGNAGGRTLHDWWRKVRPGGVLAGHGYDAENWPKNVAAVN